MRVNSRWLYDIVNTLKGKAKVKVYCDKVFTGTTIFWNGEMFEWEPGTFNSEAFFNPKYDFEILEDKTIKKLDIKQDELTENAYIINEHGTKCYMTKHSKIIALKVNDLIEKINKLKEE